MKRIHRRSVLKVAAAAAAGSLLSRAGRAWAAPDASAQLVVRNGPILTMADPQATAEAMAIRAGRIVAVGPNAAIARLIGAVTRVIDLAGKCVTPGLIDAHSHPVAFGQMERKFVILRPPKIDSFDALRAELAAAARKTPKGEWIVGRGFDTFKEDRFPRRRELDVATPDHPVLIIHWGGQFGVANTVALQKANLLRGDAQDPYGGKYLRDRDGVPDGVLMHYPAIYSVYHPQLSDQEEVECAQWAFGEFARLGVTCVHDNFCGARHARAYIQLERAGNLPCRVRVYPYVQGLQHCQQAVQNMRRYEGPLVRAQGIKLAIDGYALMYDPPAQHKHLDMPMHPQPIFNEMIAAIHKAGWQADVHAVGDRGVDWTLEAFARAAGSAAECRRRRHRIEHFPFRKADTIKRAAELDAPVCQQPLYVDIKADDFAQKLGPRGPGLVATMCPMRTFAREGVHVAYGADVPAFPSHNPLDSLRCAVERITRAGKSLDASEALSTPEAIHAHTMGSAYASFDEKELGSLEQGKLADFVIWDRDVRQARTGRQVMALKALATFVGGKAVHTAAGAPA